MDHDGPGTGWNRDPDDSNTFRYWNGSQWTAEAETHSDATGAVLVYAHGHTKRRRLLDSWLCRNPISFHVIAWFDCSVPLSRGRLSRFTGPVELRNLNDL